jgi:hypothetical protein
VYSQSSTDGQLDVYISGEITTETRDQVTRLFASAPKSGTVYFDTIGGDLMAGMELGRAIRRSGFSTDVGRQTDTGRIAPGRCHSVCTLSYAGGYFRYLQQGSQLGVHRFYRNSPGASDLDLGQVMSAQITSYMDEMGINRELFQLMVNAGRGQMIILSPEQMQRFGLSNNGFQPAAWDIEATKGLVYLKGEQENAHGTGKVLMSCAPEGGIKFSALYNAGGGMNQSIISNARHFTIRINDRFLPVNRVSQPPTLSGNYILTSVEPDAALLAQIRSATHVGFAYHGPNSDVFYGFLVDKRGMDDLVTSWIKHCQGFR